MVRISTTRRLNRQVNNKENKKTEVSVELIIVRKFIYKRNRHRQFKVVCIMFVYYCYLEEKRKETAIFTVQSMNKMVTTKSNSDARFLYVIYKIE